MTPAGASVSKPLFKNLSDEETSILIAQAQRVLIDQKIPDIIKQLNERGVKTLALTSCRTGSFGVIPSMEQWRICGLHSVHINFHVSFPTLPEHTFPEIATDRIHPPLFKEGILFVGGDVHDPLKSKGQVLASFLQWIHWTPSNVVFFDDSLYNVTTVQEEMTKRSIPYKGYFFKRKIDPSFDEKSGLFQFQTLQRHKKWLSDQEVQALLVVTKVIK